MRKNVPKKRSMFGRKQVFMCASFNDWVPVEMKSLHEVKTEREKGDKLKEFLKQSKRENNKEAL